MKPPNTSKICHVNDLNNATPKQLRKLATHVYYANRFCCVCLYQTLYMGESFRAFRAGKYKASLDSGIWYNRMREHAATYNLPVEIYEIT